MRRAGRALGDFNSLYKLAGVALAVCGIAIIIAKVPSVFWWFILGTGLVILGWKLFTY